MGLRLIWHQLPIILKLSATCLRLSYNSWQQSAIDRRLISDSLRLIKIIWQCIGDVSGMHRRCCLGNASGMHQGCSHPLPKKGKALRFNHDRRFIPYWSEIYRRLIADYSAIIKDDYYRIITVIWEIMHYQIMIQLGWHNSHMWGITRDHAVS
jgi:hypothetical protein